MAIACATMRLHLLAPTLAIALLGAGEAPPAPVASLALADGTELSKHWEASLYGKVWNDPGLAWVRQQWAKQKAELKTEPGLDLDALLLAAKGVRGEFLGMGAGPGPNPILRVQADLGVQAKGLFAVVAKEPSTTMVTVAGADEARGLGPDGLVLARHGTRLVLGVNCDAVPWPVVATPVDGRLSLDYRLFMQTMATIMPAAQRADLERTIKDLEPFLGLLVWDSSLVPQGMHEVITYDKPSPGMLPVDRALLDRFPAQALAVAGGGLDLAALWKIAGPTWLDSLDPVLHQGERLGAEATQKEVDAQLAGMGVSGGVQQLVKDLHGTFAFAVTQGMPFPGVSVVVPRSPSLDALIGVGVANLGGELPAEGASAILPVPNVPLMISLARDRNHWLLTSDAMLVESWLSGKPGGFLGSPTGKLMLAKAPANSYLLGGMDSVAALGLATGFAGMGLSQAKMLPPEARQAILAGLNRLTRDSTPAWLFSAEQGKTTRTEAEGPGLGVAPLAIIAAIAIPNLLESRVTANEAAAGATLKSGIFPAQVQFQSGGYQDQDGDNVGEYGTLGELSGRLKAGQAEAGMLKLLAGPLTQGDLAAGYHYRMYLPDGKGGAISSDDAVRPAIAPAAALTAAANAQERHFACYAWPESLKTGRTMYVLTQDGQLRSLPWDGKMPAWNAALGMGWEAEATWPVYQRGGRGRPVRPMQTEPAPDPKNLF